MPEAILDVVTKDPEEQHIAKDVGDAAVHEHRSDQREVDRNRSWLQSRHYEVLSGQGLNKHLIARYYIFTSNDFRGNGRECICEPLVSSQALQKHEDENIRKDQKV